MPRRSRIAGSIAASGCLLVAVCRLTSGEVASNGKHCLWRVTNAPAPFYLLGSVHALQSSDYVRAPAIEEAIKQSQQVWFEIDPKDESFGEKLREAANLPSGQLVQTKIHPKTYEYLRKITLSRMNDWHHLRPWAIAMLLRNPTLGNPDYRWGVDSYIAQRARYYGKPTGGLETTDEHIRVFSDMFDAEGEVVLLQAIIPQKNKQGSSEKMWRLLDRRNKRWIPKIETAIRSGRPTLIVAGALHFAGPRGVVALLQQRGYKIEQL